MISSDSITAEAVQELQAVFNIFDKGGQDALDVKELGTALRAAGQNPTEQEIVDFMNEVDAEGKGTVSFQTFLGLVARKMGDTASEEELKIAFQMFDRDNTGYIPSTDLRIVLCTIGDKLTDTEMNELLAETEQDMDGNVNYEEFVKKIYPAKSGP
eukprot:RCo000764